MTLSVIFLIVLLVLVGVLAVGWFWPMKPIQNVNDNTIPDTPTSGSMFDLSELRKQKPYKASIRRPY